MIISCENCGTKFQVPDKSITDAGRFLRCSICEHEWLFEITKQELESNIQLSTDSDNAASLNNTQVTENLHIQNKEILSAVPKHKEIIFNTDSIGQKKEKRILIQALKIFTILIAFALIYIKLYHESILYGMNEEIKGILRFNSNATLAISDISFAIDDRYYNESKGLQAFLSLHCTIINTTNKNQSFAKIKVTVLNQNHKSIGHFRANLSEIFQPKESKYFDFKVHITETPVYIKIFLYNVENDLIITKEFLY